MESKTRPAVKRITAIDILCFLQASKCTLEALQRCSPRKEDSFLSMACVFLSIKDTFDNRNRIYVCVKRQGNQISNIMCRTESSVSTLDNAHASATLECVEISSTGNRSKLLLTSELCSVDAASGKSPLPETRLQYLVDSSFYGKEATFT